MKTENLKSIEKQTHHYMAEIDKQSKERKKKLKKEFSEINKLIDEE